MTFGDDLRRTVRGRVLVAGDEGFEQARKAWNLSVDQRVRAVVEAEDADDVAALAAHAHRVGLSVAAQPSGHGASGDTDGVILLRTRRLGGVEVRPERRTARVGAGVAWGEVLSATSPYGLTGLAGSSPAPNVVGYTLGGGLSWFSRRYGFAADSVRAFEVVDVEGRRGTVTADSDAELFWALRGGGGDFALVTAIEFDLHPAPALYGGRVMWPVERAPEVLAAFREITEDAPEELTVWFQLLNLPPLPELPEFLRGRSVVTVDTTFLGEEGEARALLRRLDKIDGSIMDSRGMLPVAELGGICAEPTAPSYSLARGGAADRPGRHGGRGAAGRAHRPAGRRAAPPPGRGAGPPGRGRRRLRSPRRAVHPRPDRCRAGPRAGARGGGPAGGHRGPSRAVRQRAQAVHLSREGGAGGGGLPGRRPGPAPRRQAGPRPARGVPEQPPGPGLRP
ncbi:hypothetical protein GCM10018953_02180 [Streptosporangium nondiastaticum]|uniref:FAD-binding oxidoreductase n=1 Tax=Streptosporangium nondiastaticum TaxID=35764 RepID=UPI0031F81CE7